jgi:uncharacterized membrane protein
LRKEGEFEARPYKVIGLAAIAGLRSMAAPALLSRAVRRGDLEGLQGTPFAALGSPKVSTALQLLMIGEMIADKTPIIPSRTSAPALLGRALSGALVGGALSAAEERRAASGAVLGALCAVVAAYVGEQLRVKGAEKLGVPAQILGLLEDGIVLFGGTYLPRNSLEPRTSALSRDRRSR